MVNQYHSDTRSTNATMLMFNQRDGDVLVFTKKLWGMECIRMTAVANARIAAAHLLHCHIFCIGAHVLLPRLGWQLPAPKLQESAMLNAVFTFTKAIYLQDRSPRILDWTYHGGLTSGKFCAMVKVKLSRDRIRLLQLLLSAFLLSSKPGEEEKTRTNANIQKSKVGLGPRWIQVSPPLCNLPRAFTLKSLPTHQYHQSIMFSLWMYIVYYPFWNVIFGLTLTFCLYH